MIIWMLIGYMFLYIHRPFEVWPVLGIVRLELLYMIATTIVWLGSPKVINVNRLTFVISAFAVTMLFSWVTSAYADDGTIELTNWLKLLPFYLMVITSIKDERDLKRVICGFMVVMFIYMAHSLREFINGRHVYRMGIARMVGVDTSLSDPNSFAASVVYALPMVFPVWALRTNRKQTFAIVCYVVLSATCILLTGSRTGLVGLIACGLSFILVSRRRAIILVCLAIIAPICWLALPQDLQSRYLTIIDNEQGPANAQESKDSRLLLFYVAIDLWEESPILGHGPASFYNASGTGYAAHTLYGQVIAELGLMGIFCLIGLIACASINFFESRHLVKVLSHESSENNFCYLLIRSVLISFALLLLLGCGGHNFYRFTWLWYSAFQGLSLSFLRQQAEEVERGIATHDMGTMNSPMNVVPNYRARAQA